MFNRGSNNLVLVDLAGQFEDTLLHKGGGECVHSVTSFVGRVDTTEAK